MSSMIFPATTSQARAHPAADTNRRYCGPERRSALPESVGGHWLAATLDELDYGVLLLRGDARVLHVNHAACSELDETHPLQLLDGHLRVRRGPDVAPLHEALCAAALRGLRKLLTLGYGGQRVSVSVVPLGSDDPAADAGGASVVLVILGKRQVCEALSVQGFARSQGLSTAETRVLALLCQGTSPNAIAAQFGVAISTVRTQIGNIRTKTGACSIQALVRQVAVLPPLMGVLRGKPRRAAPAAPWHDARMALSA
jgi:DNA-binding CsgD family transcriptional regulator